MSVSAGDTGRLVIYPPHLGLDCQYPGSLLMMRIANLLSAILLLIAGVLLLMSIGHAGPGSDRLMNTGGEVPPPAHRVP